LLLILLIAHMYPEYMAERGPRPASEGKQVIPNQHRPVEGNELFDRLIREAEQVSPGELTQINQAADALQASLDMEGIQPLVKITSAQPDKLQDIPAAVPPNQPQSGDTQ
jgi:hypothetical protein